MYLTPSVMSVQDAIGGNRKHWENNTRKTLNQLLVEMVSKGTEGGEVEDAGRHGRQDVSVQVLRA